jgi:hypothetical protein
MGFLVCVQKQNLPCINNIPGGDPGVVYAGVSAPPFRNQFMKGFMKVYEG